VVVGCGVVSALLTIVQPTGVKPGPAAGPLQGSSDKGGPVSVSDCGRTPDDS